MAHRVHQSYDDHRNFYIEAHRFMLLKIQKVASTSLWVSMAQLLGHSVKTREQLLGIQLPKLSGLLLQEYPKVFKAGFVRNPWDRLLSCYLQKKVYKRHKFYKRNNIDPEISFPDFVKTVCAIPDWKADKHFRSQFTFVCNFEGELLTDYIGRFEYLNEDFNTMCRLANLPNAVLPHWNTTAHEVYTKYYTPVLVDQVAQRYEIDLALFGYKYGQALSEEARHHWNNPIPLSLKIKIAQYKSAKLLNCISELSAEVNLFECD